MTQKLTMSSQEEGYYMKKELKALGDKCSNTEGERVNSYRRERINYREEEKMSKDNNIIIITRDKKD